jgi:uncharacterized protein with PIN domain
MPSDKYPHWQDETGKVEEALRAHDKDISIEHLEAIRAENIGEETYFLWDGHASSGRFWIIGDNRGLYVAFRQDEFKSLRRALTVHLGILKRTELRLVDENKERFSELLGPWRQYEQAAEALQNATEAEEFQAVGMRCRECLLAMVSHYAEKMHLQVEQPLPKQGDFLRWSELIVRYLLVGSQFSRARKHLKDTASTTWSLCAWLTHYRDAMRDDAELALDATAHVLTVFGSADRRRQASPPRCTTCGSYRIVTAASGELVCAECGRVVESIPSD